MSYTDHWLATTAATSPASFVMTRDDLLRSIGLTHGRDPAWSCARVDIRPDLVTVRTPTGTMLLEARPLCEHETGYGQFPGRDEEPAPAPTAPTPSLGEDREQLALTHAQALQLLARCSMRPFEKGDWMAYAGCESRDPMIGSIDGHTLVLDARLLCIERDIGDHDIPSSADSQVFRLRIG